MAKFVYVSSESEIIQSPTTTVDHAESEGSMSYLHTINRQNYPLKFKMDLCWYEENFSTTLVLEMRLFSNTIIYYG
jgi:hypothetical protein